MTALPHRLRFLPLALGLLLPVLGCRENARPVVVQAPPSAAAQATVPPPRVYTAWPFEADVAAWRQADTARTLGIEKELTLDLGGGVTMKLVLIPAGQYMMGSPDNEPDRWPSEGPQHEVTLDRPFYMGVYEVTQAQYKAVMGFNPSHFSVGASFPVNYDSWDDATDFCEALSADTGRKVTLPTEAQWEYACRAGTATAYNFGPTVGPGQANYIVSWGKDGKKGEGQFAPVPVGSYAPNAFGLYDMHGNVDEWCTDRYYEDAYANAGPRNPADGELQRVVRGGGARGDAGSCRSAARGSFEQWTKLTDIGFRVIVPIGEETPAPLSATDEARRLLEDASHIHHRDSRGIERMTARLAALGPEAKPVLTAAIQDKDLRVYQCATAALSYLATADDVPVLLEVPWRPADRDDIFWLDATSHATVALDVVAPTATTQLLEALKSPEPGIRQKAIELLDKTDTKVDADQILEIATRDENQDVRWAALRMAMRRGDKRAIDRAFELATKDADKAVRRGGLSLGLQFHDKRAADLLIADFKANDETWYSLALVAHDERLIPFLIQGLGMKASCTPMSIHRILRERYAADPRVIEAIPDLAASHKRSQDVKRLEAEGVESLLKKLRDPDAALAKDAAEALGHLRDRRATQPLLEAVASPACPFKNMAFIALGEIGDPATVGPLVQIFNDNHSSGDEKSWALRTLVDLHAKEALAPTLAVIENEEEQMYPRYSAIRSLLAMKAYEPLVAMAISGPGYNRRAAVDALGDLGDPRALPVLEKLVRTPCDMMTRLGACYALEKLRKAPPAPAAP